MLSGRKKRGGGKKSCRTAKEEKKWREKETMWGKLRKEEKERKAGRNVKQQERTKRGGLEPNGGRRGHDIDLKKEGNRR